MNQFCVSRRKWAFTLIELLIVVAIIAILAAIAVPNFLDAQVRAKVSRAQSDMRSIDTAITMYILEWNNEPRVTNANNPNNPGEYSSWWGFVSYLLTTPQPYMSTLPPMPFIDKQVLASWRGLGAGNGQSNQPYTVIRNTGVPYGWQPGLCYTNNSGLLKYNILISQKFHDDTGHSNYILYTCGPDSMDTTVWGTPEYYDPSNGSISFGDIYRFGGGNAESDGKRNNMN